MFRLITVGLGCWSSPTQLLSRVWSRRIGRFEKIAANLVPNYTFQSHGVHSCLSVRPHPDIVEFDSADVFGGINMELEEVNNKDLERVNKNKYNTT